VSFFLAQRALKALLDAFVGGILFGAMHQSFTVVRWHPTGCNVIPWGFGGARIRRVGGATDRANL